MRNVLENEWLSVNFWFFTWVIIGSPRRKYTAHATPRRTTALCRDWKKRGNSSISAVNTHSALANCAKNHTLLLIQIKTQCLHCTNRVTICNDKDAIKENEKNMIKVMITLGCKTTFRKNEECFTRELKPRIPIIKKKRIDHNGATLIVANPSG